MMMLSVLVILWLLRATTAGSGNNTSKDFKMERFSPCKSDLDYTILFNCIIPNRPLTNKITMSGAIVVKENITGPIEMKTKINRCNMDMSYCVNYDTIVLPTMCSKLIDKASPWSIWADSFEPKFKCPLYENTYTTINGSLDLTAVARLPIEGFHWIMKFEFYEISKSQFEENIPNPSSRLLLCLDSDFTVRIPRNARKKNWSSNTKILNEFKGNYQLNTEF